MALNETIIHVEGLHKHFGRLHVLRGIDLTIRRGEVMVIIGPSGSGKSTLLRCLNRLEEPSGGRILFEGQDILAHRVNPVRIRQRIGMVFQHFNLFPHMSALGNVMEGPRTVLGMGRKDAETLAMELLDKVGLSDKAHARPAELSGGQQQRVAIARALALNPTIMLFDEVTSALDPELVEGVLQVMRQLANEGMTMVVVTHEIEFAKSAADRVAMMDAGQVIEVGPPQTIFRSATHDRTRRFLRQLLREEVAT